MKVRIVKEPGSFGPIYSVEKFRNWFPVWLYVGGSATLSLEEARRNKEFLERMKPSKEVIE